MVSPPSESVFLHHCRCCQKVFSVIQGHAVSSSDANTSQVSSDSQQHSAILQASLQFVPEHGWSSAALTQGAQSLGLPGMAHGMFPRGGGELVDYFEAKCNADLVEFMQQQE